MVEKSDSLSENVDRMETVGFTGEIRSKEGDRNRGAPRITVLSALNDLGK